MKRISQTAIIAISLTYLASCAAGKAIMAGYTPPQTIADLLREQGDLSPEQGAIAGIESEYISGGKISPDGYKGQIASNQADGYESALTAPPEARYLQPWANADTGFRPTFSHKSLQDYASQLSMQLMKNSVGINQQDLIGVASFVMLDSTLQNTNVLGNQLSEYFISEIQQFGMSVIDFKMRNTVQVSERGDFVFSRNAINLAQQLKMDHVLSGTLIEKATGVQVNARIVELGNKRVVASASVIVPHFIADSLSRNYVSAGQ